jgi:RimJ/RimL family protein N-acetyltransferase
MTSTTERLVVRRLEPDDWRTWRAVRLTALADAPYAFGSSLAVEQDFDEATWRGRLAPDNGMTAVAFLGEHAIGVMGGYTPEGTDAVLLIAAWVHTGARGRGVGDALVAEVLAWSREHGYERVELRVADGNESARNLFLRNGFVPTGVREPLESDPSVGTERLAYTLS